MEDLIFVGIDMESLRVDYEDWKDRFVEFTEHEKDGYRFLLVNNQMEKKIGQYIMLILDLYQKEMLGGEIEEYLSKNSHGTKMERQILESH